MGDSHKSKTEESHQAGEGEELDILRTSWWSGRHDCQGDVYLLPAQGGEDLHDEHRDQVSHGCGHQVESLDSKGRVMVDKMIVLRVIVNCMAGTWLVSQREGPVTRFYPGTISA